MINLRTVFLLSCDKFTVLLLSYDKFKGSIFINMR